MGDLSLPRERQPRPECQAIFGNLFVRNADIHVLDDLGHDSLAALPYFQRFLRYVEVARNGQPSFPCLLTAFEGEVGRALADGRRDSRDVEPPGAFVSLRPVDVAAWRAKWNCTRGRRRPSKDAVRARFDEIDSKTPLAGQRGGVDAEPAQLADERVHDRIVGGSTVTNREGAPKPASATATLASPPPKVATN